MFFPCIFNISTKLWFDFSLVQTFKETNTDRRIITNKTNTKVVYENKYLVFPKKGDILAYFNNETYKPEMILIPVCSAAGQCNCETINKAHKGLKRYMETKKIKGFEVGTRAQCLMKRFSFPDRDCHYVIILNNLVKILKDE